MTKYRIPVKTTPIGYWSRPKSCLVLQHNDAYRPIKWWSKDVTYNYMRFRYWSEFTLEHISRRIDRTLDALSGGWDV